MADTPDTDAEPKRRARKPKADAATTAAKKPRISRKTSAGGATSAAQPARRVKEAADLAKSAAGRVRKASGKVGTASAKAAKKVTRSAKSAGITRTGLIAGAAVAVVGVAAGLAATVGRKRVVAASEDLSKKVKDSAARVKARIEEARHPDEANPAAKPIAGE